MASTDVSSESAGATSNALGVDMNLEVMTLPVSDVDRSKAFTESLGWRLDIDLVLSDEVRTVQFTPPHSGCSIQFGKPGSTAEPGSAQKTFVVVKDIDAARDDLISRGVNVSEIQVAVPPGFDAQGGRSYFARASFSDPDGSSWVLQEITNRLPGPAVGEPTCRSPRLQRSCTRWPSTTARSSARTSRPTARRWDWTPRYTNARESGRISADESSAAAGRYMGT